MIESVLAIIGAALSIWESKERTKYQDELISLKNKFYDELKKDPSVRDSAVLDDVLNRLRVLCNSLSTAITGKNP